MWVAEHPRWVLDLFCTLVRDGGVNRRWQRCRTQMVNEDRSFANGLFFRGVRGYSVPQLFPDLFLTRIVGLFQFGDLQSRGSGLSWEYPIHLSVSTSHQAGFLS